MAQDIFLNIAGIKGESQDAVHSNEIDVLSWHWSIQQPSSLHRGSGGGTGRCTVSDLVFDHYVDRASPNLMWYCIKGTHIDSAILVMRKAGGIPLEYLKITMEQVMITRVKPVGGLNMRAPRERVSLSFARVRQEYVRQDDQGRHAGTISRGYDIKAQRAI